MDLFCKRIIWFKPQPFLEMARSVLCLTLAAAWTSLVGGLPQFLDERQLRALPSGHLVAE